MRKLRLINKLGHRQANAVNESDKNVNKKKKI